MSQFRNSFLILVSILLSLASAQSVKFAPFKQTFEDFKNPERGWMRAVHIDNTEYPENFRIEANSTLQWVVWTIDNYKDKPLTQELFNDFNQMFEDARKAGIKIVFRLRYNHGKGDDAEFKWVMEHINQMKPILHQNSDVLLLLDPGLIGYWGEWHTSNKKLLLPDRRNAIIEALLTATPKDRMIYLRYPVFKQDYLAFKGIKNPILDSTTAFNQSDMARIGHLNDCLFTNSHDGGTYDSRPPEESLTKIDRISGLKYLSAESPFVPHGGETCEEGENGQKINKWNSCENVLKEFPMLGTTHLHSDYYKEIYNQWKKFNTSDITIKESSKDEGCYSKISRSLGYRFVLREAYYTPEVPPGGLFKLSIKLDNTGYGKLFNPRDVYLIIENASGKKEIAPIAVDPRFWRGGKTRVFEVQMEIPIQMTEGMYKLSLWMPDKSDKIKNNPAYAVRFASTNDANKDVWDPKTGYNLLASDIRVSKSATGPVNKSFVTFKQNGATNTPIRMVGKNLPQELNIQYNPITRVIQLNTPTHGKSVNLQLFDALGNKVSANSMELMSSSNQTIWKVNQLRPGIYWARVTFGDKTQVSKIVLPQ